MWMKFSWENAQLTVWIWMSIMTGCAIDIASDFRFMHLNWVADIIIVLKFVKFD